MKRFCLIITINIAYLLGGFSQPPFGYYSGTEDLIGEELLVELHNIIKDHTQISYTDLWDAFFYTDQRDDGKVWDMYSSCNFIFFEDQDTGTGGTSECDVYNREHSFPRSWFGGAIAPMNSDLFHIYPTDKKVNAVRDNYPYGNVGSASYTSSNGSKLGTSSMPGFSGIVFEPIDEYKGDFARSYFYMATRYYNQIHTWSSEMLNGTQYPAFTDWAINVLLEWHQLDPVSSKEIDRNNTIYEEYQFNRNPFIDNPTFANLIWADEPTPVIITSTPDTQVDVYEYYTYSIVATGGINNISFICNQKPEWLDFQQTGNGLALLSGTPLIDDIGDHVVSILATDGTTSDIQEFVVNVLGNTTPVVFTSNPITTITAYENYTYNILAIGHNLATITITCSEKPEWMTFEQTGNGIAQLMGFPTSSDIGNHSVSLLATDGLSFDHQEFEVLVAEPNISFLTIPETFAKVGEPYEYFISVEIVENPSAQVSISCNEKPDWLTFSSVEFNEAMLLGTPSLQDIGNHYVELAAIFEDFVEVQSFNIFVFEHGTMLDYVETFENIPESSPEYESQYWVGDNDFEWFATSARTDQSLDGRAICLEDQGEPFIESQLLTGGCNKISYIFQQKFDGSDGAISLFINDLQIGNPVVASPEIFVAEFDNIGVTGSFTIKLLSNGSTAIAIDNLSWESFSSSVPPEIINVSHSPQNPSSGDEVIIMAEVISDNEIESVSIIWGTLSEYLTENQPMLYSDGFYTGNIIIPDNAIQIYYQIKAIDNLGLLTLSEVFEISIYQNQPPVIGNVEFFPINPNENQGVSVRAMVYDPELDPFIVYLKWQINDQAVEDSIQMADQSGYYVCTIPSNPAGSVIDFQVFAKDDKGAIGTSSIYSYTVSPDTKVDGFYEKRLLLFPNPTQGKIYITAEFNDPLAIDIYSITGNSLISLKHNEQLGLIEVDLGSLAKGFYIVKISLNGNFKIYKVVKE